MQDGCVHVALVEWRCRIAPSHQSTPLLSIVTIDPYELVYANQFVRVSYGDIEGKVVVEGSVSHGRVGETELSQRGIGDCNFRLFGTEDEHK